MIKTVTSILIISALTSACSLFDSKWECSKLKAAKAHNVGIFPESEIKSMIARQLNIKAGEVDTYCQASQ